MSEVKDSHSRVITPLRILMRATRFLPVFGVLLAVLMIGATPLRAQKPVEKEAPTLTPMDRAFAVKHLQVTRTKFLSAVKGLSEAQWQYKPAPDRWSIAEIAEHIATVEESLYGMITEKLVKSPATPDKERATTDEMVLTVVTDRSNKFQAPERVRPTGRWASPEETIQEFEKLRARTIAYVETTSDDLRNHFAKFGPSGEIDAYQFLLVLSGHSERHTIQIHDVKSDPNFPK